MEDITHGTPSRGNAGTDEELIGVFGRFELRARLVQRGDALVPRRPYCLYLENDGDYQFIRTTRHSDRAGIISDLRDCLLTRLEKIHWHNILLTDIQEDDTQISGCTEALEGMRDLIHDIEAGYKKLLLAMAELEADKESWASSKSDAAVNEYDLDVAAQRGTYLPRCQRCQRRYDPVGTQWEDFETPWLRGVDPHFGVYRGKRDTQRIVSVCESCVRQLHEIAQQIVIRREELKQIWPTVTTDWQG